MESNDEDIRIQKKNMWKALKKWLRLRRELDRIELREEKKRLKKNN